MSAQNANWKTKNGKGKRKMPKMRAPKTIVGAELRSHFALCILHFAFCIPSPPRSPSLRGEHCSAMPSVWLKGPVDTADLSPLPILPRLAFGEALGRGFFLRRLHRGRFGRGGVVRLGGGLLPAGVGRRRRLRCVFPLRRLFHRRSRRFGGRGFLRVRPGRLGDGVFLLRRRAPLRESGRSPFRLDLQEDLADLRARRDWRRSRPRAGAAASRTRPPWTWRPPAPAPAPRPSQRPCR